jgi:hypothetical protein
VSFGVLSCIKRPAWPLLFLNLMELLERITVKTSDQPTARTRLLWPLIALLVTVTTGCAQSGSSPVTTDKARSAGQAVAKDAKDAGAAIGQTGREIGHSVKDAAVGAWEATRQGAQAVGAAASGAVTELRK